LVEQALQLRGEDDINVVLFDREIVGVFAIHLGLISGTGDVPFPGTILLLIECARVGLVPLEAADESGMEPATTLMTFWVSVPVLSVQTMEAFAIVSQEQNTNEEVFLSHPFRGESERKRRSPRVGGLPEQRQQPVLPI